MASKQKPGECLKTVNVYMHPSLLEQWYCADVARELAAIGVRPELHSDLYDEDIVLWSRKVQPTVLGDTKPDIHHGRPCGHTLHVMPAERLARLMQASDLRQFMSRRLCGLQECKVTLLVFGLSEYNKKSGRRADQSKIDKLKLESNLVDLLVTLKCDTIMAETPNEVALHIAQFTKAFAELPQKLAKRQLDDQSEFYMRGDKKNCVAIDNNGNGTARLWQQMLAILPMSSLETSRAICEKYKTPRAMFKALEAPDGVRALAELPVTRSGVPGARGRRLGPEMARKLHTLFTATDGNLLVD